MNKKKKKIFGGISALVGLGGIAGGIISPVVISSLPKEVGILLSVDTDGDLIEGMTFSEFSNADMVAQGLEEKATLNKIEFKLNETLYTEEQEASYDLQDVYFQWDLYDLKKRIVKILINDLKYSVTTLKAELKVPSKIESKDLKTLFATLKAEYAKMPSSTDKEKADKESVDSKIKSYEDDWKKKEDLIKKVKAKNVDFDSSTLTSDFPKLLQPISKIRSKQTNFYNDTKNGVINNYETKAEGLKVWKERLTSQYNGATNDTEAIDHLVNVQISRTSFGRFTYTLNSSFTVEQLKTDIFKDYIGTYAEAIAVPSGTDTRKTFVGKDSSNNDDTDILEDNVYFLGTGSLKKEFFNSTQNVQANLGNSIALVENAILGLKPGTEDRSEPWTIDKELLKKLMMAFEYKSGSVSTGVKLWKSDLFGGDDEITKQIIARASGTTDSTQWLGGSLGWRKSINHIEGVNGYKLGVLAALSGDGGSNPASLADKSWPNALSDLTTAIETGVADAAAAIGWTIPAAPTAIPAAPTANDIALINTYNTMMSNFIDSLSEDQIKQYIGQKVSAKVANRPPTTGAGLPAAVEIKPNIFMVTNDNFGIHIIRITTGKDIKDKMIKDFIKVADEQDEAKKSTNYANVFNTALTQYSKIGTLLGMTPPASGTGGSKATLESATNNPYVKILEDNYKDIGDFKSASDMSESIAQLIYSKKKSENIDEINTLITEDFLTWYQEKIDKGIRMVEAGLEPENLWNRALELGGV